MGEYTTTVAEYAAAALARMPAGSALIEQITVFLQQVVEVSATNYAVKVVAQGLGVPGHGADEAEAAAGACLASMIAAAQDAGQVHPDVTVADIYLLISTAPIDQSAELRARWFTLMLPGLTSTASR